MAKKARKSAPTGLASEPGLTEVAYRKLEELIVTLQIPPGSLVSEADLSERLGIGRTPVREAMQRLARERLIRVMPSRGCHITEVSIDEQLKLLEVRRDFEALLVRTAVARASDEERVRFREIAKAMRQALTRKDFSAFRDLDVEFNALCEKACRNELLSSTMKRLNPLARRFWYVHHGKSLPEIGVQAHIEMADAIAGSDEKKALAASKKLCDFIEQTTRKTMVYGS